MATRFVLNVGRIDFDDGEVRIGVFPYEGSEQLNELRNSHRSTHVVRREGGSQIVAVPVVPPAPEVGETFKTIKVKNNLGLCAALIRNAVLNHLHSLPRKVFDYHPLSFLADESRDNLLRSSLPSGLACPEWLTLCPWYEAEIRVIYFDRRPPFVGMCLNVRTRKGIDCTCHDLLEAGMTLRGLYVGEKVASGDGRIQPRFRLKGRVESVNEGWLLLSDCREGEDRVAAAEAFLEPTWASFNACITHVFQGRADQVQTALEKALVVFRSGPKGLERLRSIAGYFAGRTLEMVPGVTFRCQNFITQADRASFPQIDKAPPVVYVFDPTGTRTDTWHDRGIDSFGPYTAQTFTPTRPRICVICRATNKGRVEQFVRKFLHGIVVPGAKRSPFSKGLVRKFGLENASTDFFEVVGDSPSAYQRTVRQALAAQNERDIRWNLALVEVEEGFHRLKGTANPYLVSKVEFLTHQIPVQEFEIETTEIPDKRLGYVLNNMALATYAKLGGIPWLVKAHPTIAHELVFGLGSANIGQGRLGASERVVGITTVFSGDGNYCLSTLSQAVAYQDYQQALLSSLKNTIQRIATSMNWQKGEHIRLVFHAFKPFKDSESEAVKALMATLGDYDVEYAFIHVVEDHPYLLFDEAQPGLQDYESRGMKGVYAPVRGGYLRLSDSEVLITLTGAREVKRAEDGMPRPVLLKLGRESTFKDMTYLTRQINTFACHSWRSYFPSPFPVTIMYSELIARLLGHLATVPQWNPTVMLGRIGETRWFL